MKFDRTSYDWEAKDRQRKRALLIAAVVVGLVMPASILVQASLTPGNPLGAAFLIGVALWFSRFLYRRSRDLEASFFATRLTPDSSWEEKHFVEWVAILCAVGLPLFIAGRQWLWP